MANVRYSKQRELILNNLKQRCDHPSAEEIYSDLKKDNPSLSLGTVYRNLAFLVDANQIRKLDVGDVTVHYDGDTHEHHHFICSRCKTIHDINYNLEETLSNEIKKHSAHRIDHLDIVMVGVCEDCLKKEN